MTKTSQHLGPTMLSSLLDAVDEVVRCNRLADNAKAAQRQALRDGKLTSEIAQACTAADAELRCALVVLAVRRGSHLEATTPPAPATAGGA